MPQKIAFLTTQYKEVKSGPGRFAEYLRQLHGEDLQFHFFSDQIVKDEKNEWSVSLPNWLKKLPLSWLPRSFVFAKKVNKVDDFQHFDWILASDYAVGWALAMQKPKARLAIMVNDDNFLLIYQAGEHQKGMSTGKRWARRMGYFFEKSAVKRADLVISNSLYTKSLVEKFYPVPASRSQLLYKAVDLSYFNWKPRTVIPPRHFLFVKNDWRRGGLDLILSAFSKLSHQNEIQFTVAGISEQEKISVSVLIQQSSFQGNTTVLGLIKRPELMELIDKADVFISMSRQEALGVSCLEAMAAGLPIIATDAGGLKEVLDYGKAGCMLPVDDAGALLQLLTLLESEPELLLEKAAHAKIHVANFSVDNLEKNLKNSFSRAL